MKKFNVEIILGSQSDKKALDDSKMTSILKDCGVSWQLSIISAHRNPGVLSEFIGHRSPKNAGHFKHAPIYIGIAGMAAALPGNIAALTKSYSPVIGVALSTEILDGLDSALSQTRMPPGVPVIFAGYNLAGMKNAALIAVQIMARSDEDIGEAYVDYLSNNQKAPIIGLEGWRTHPHPTAQAK